MAFAAVLALCDPATAAPLSLADLRTLALRCGVGVAPSTLASIAQAESGREPLAISDNDFKGLSASATRGDAIAMATKLIKAGHSVDLGLMQINSRTLAALGLAPQDAFDPCTSIAAAATILAGDYADGQTHDSQQFALRIALSRYNTGDALRGFKNGYVHKVELAARQVVPEIDAPVERSPATSPRQVVRAVPQTADPNAPPPWDVWSSFDYEITRVSDHHSSDGISDSNDPQDKGLESIDIQHRLAAQF